MNNDMTIEQMMAELNEQIAWFQGDDFNLDKAKQRFIEARELSKKLLPRWKICDMISRFLARILTLSRIFTPIKA